MKEFLLIISALGGVILVAIKIAIALKQRKKLEKEQESLANYPQNSGPNVIQISGRDSNFSDESIHIGGYSNDK